MSRVSHILVRGVALAVASLLCAFAAATATLVGLQLSLPPSDLAYGRGLTRVWSDPFVRAVATDVAWTGAAIGYVFALWMLWNTRLLLSIPLVFVVAVVVSGLFGRLWPIAPILALICSIGAMQLCRHLFPRQRPVRPRSTG